MDKFVIKMVAKNGKCRELYNEGSSFKLKRLAVDDDKSIFNGSLPNKLLCHKKDSSEDKDISKHIITTNDNNWKYYNKENLNYEYRVIFSKLIADGIFKRLEEEVEYFSGDLLKVRVYGKWHNIPRKQVSFGDPGLSYSFSGSCIPAVPWNKSEIVMELKQSIESITGCPFNFVLINRYKDGMDHMGEHRDDEKDLVADAPIASLSFGQPRDFIFKHKDSRTSNATRSIPPIKLELQHGSLLLMKSPTNKYWYHGLPVRKKAKNVRINLTFRRMVAKNT